MFHPDDCTKIECKFLHTKAICEKAKKELCDKGGNLKQKSSGKGKGKGKGGKGTHGARAAAAVATPGPEQGVTNGDTS